MSKTRVQDATAAKKAFAGQAQDFLKQSFEHALAESEKQSDAPPAWAAEGDAAWQPQRGDDGGDFAVLPAHLDNARARDLIAAVGDAASSGGADAQEGLDVLVGTLEFYERLHARYLAVANELLAIGVPLDTVHQLGLPIQGTPLTARTLGQAKAFNEGLGDKHLPHSRQHESGLLPLHPDQPVNPKYQVVPMMTVVKERQALQKARAELKRRDALSAEVGVHGDWTEAPRPPVLLPPDKEA